MKPFRLLALSIGNSSLLAGWFAGKRLRRSFRGPVSAAASPAAFRRGMASRLPKAVDGAVLCSVVPALTETIAGRIRSRWGVAPLVLTARSPHGLAIGYRRPGRLGADRVAAALGARAAFPGRNLIVVDCGTATTVTALSREGALLGGAILPGADLWPAMLAARTAQLPAVAVRRPRSPLGRSTEEGLRSGSYHGHAGAVRELVRRVRAAAFGRADAVVVGTGGRASALAREGIFDRIVPGLVLHGLRVYGQAGHCKPRDRSLA